LTAEKTGDEVEITIGDQGRGIPDDRKDILLNRFWRSIENEDVHGKGMGLSLVKMVVDRYGGQVRIENRVEGDHTQGTKVVLNLPLSGD
jgi:signal transduction histidine kinase